MLPVDKKAVAEMHAKNKVLLFHVEDLPPLIYERMHTANEYHWHPENGKIAGRPLLDCSNCAPGETPLNSEATKELDIARYQKVRLPTFHEVMLAWETSLKNCNGKICGCCLPNGIPSDLQHHHDHVNMRVWCRYHSNGLE